MTKTDLETILLKIRNRCGLEEQSRITYYWDDEGRIVFKIFFDSLYLPKELRVGEDNIQNMFLTQNVYAYKDEFQIIELNQDEGFIKILPDDQDFIVIDSYKSAKQDAEESKKDKEKEESVKLAGKRLNEDYALMKGYLLQESDSEKAESDALLRKDINAQEKAQAPKVKEKEPKDIHAYVAVINNPIQQGVGKDTTEALIKPLRGIPPKAKDGALSKLFIGIPDTPAGNKLNSYNAYSVARLNDVVLEATGKAVGGVYLLCSQNSKSAEQVLAASNVIDVTYLTDESAAKELLKSVNAQQLLSAPEAKSTKNELVQDTTSLAKVEQLAEKIIEKYRDMIQTYGGVRKDPSQKTFVSAKSSKAKKESETKETTPKTTASVGNTSDRKSKLDRGKTKETKNWDKAKENLAAAIKADPNVDAAIKLLCDLCPDSMDGEDKKVYEARKKEYGAAWAVLGPLGRPLTGFYDSLKAHCNSLVSQTLLNALSKGVSTAQERAADELTGQEANAGTTSSVNNMVSNKKSNQASKTANVSLTYKGSKKGETPKDTSERISDYTNDFPVFCAYWQDIKTGVNPNGKFNPMFEDLLSQIDVSGVKDANSIASTGAQEVKAEDKKEEPENDAAQNQPNDEPAEQKDDEPATSENDAVADSSNDEAANNGDDK